MREEQQPHLKLCEKVMVITLLLLDANMKRQLCCSFVHRVWPDGGARGKTIL